MAGADRYQSFGRLRRAKRRAVDIGNGPREWQSRPVAGGYLPFGAGRSYGDSCHNDGGTLIDSRSAATIRSFDPATGRMVAEAGVTLDAMIARAAPRGFFLPVTPGTRYVTLGGAIANDVHGKNHHRRGTFGAHIAELVLLRSDRDGAITCSRQCNRELFEATIGGMGLTGIILSATIDLMATPTPDVMQTVMPFGSIGAYLDLAEETDRDNEYAVAWVDSTARGSRRGRGVLLAANHADQSSGRGDSDGRRLSVPFTPPVPLLSGLGVRAFNTAYRRAQLRKVGEARRVGWRSYFYPLDAVDGWNRLYGPRGLMQHQSVVPVEAAQTALPELLREAEEAGQASFLTVLKRFGPAGSAGLLGFARPGYTLTLDFAYRGSVTLGLFERLDRIAIEAGGAVNPYKDARMGPDVFAASFPQWQKLERLRDPLIMSDFWRRTAGRMTGETADPPTPADLA